MSKSKTFSRLEFDQTQSFYQLSCIQNVGRSIPAAMLGKLLLVQYGAGTALCSIFVGNLILWLVGLAIISTVYQAHTNAIENIEGYLGKYGGLIFAIVLIATFMAWYVNQISLSIGTLKTIPQLEQIWKYGFDIRIGAVLGLFAALLAVGGMKVLKWLTAVSFPFLVAYHLYVIFTSDNPPVFSGTWGLSLPAVVMIVLLDLPAAINLPTFFRHSKSRADSFLALSLIVIFTTFFECATFWMDFPSLFGFSADKGTLANIFTPALPFIFFLILTAICVNMLNIYLASACYERFAPKFEGIKGNAIIGLLGTAAYTFIQISSPIVFSLNLLNSYLAILGIVLLISVLSRLIIHHRPVRLEKLINLFAWITGCSCATFFASFLPEKNISGLFYGMGASAFFFLVVFFFEETAWAIKKIQMKTHLPSNDND